MKHNPWRRIAMTVGAMAAVLLLAASWRYFASRGVFTSVEDKALVQCRSVAGIGGVTALASDLRDGVVYIATRNGAIYASLNGVVTPMSGTSGHFRPVALSVSHAAHEGARLRAISMREDGTYYIAVFEVSAGKLSEIGRLTTDMLNDPADLASLDGERFYLVNRHSSRTALGRWLDDTFLFTRAEVLYFDGMKFVTVAKGLNSPAGIALSPDNTHLYVSEDYPRTLVNFARNDFTGATENPTVLSIASGLGKIHAAKDGSLIIAARPKAGMGQVWRVKDGTAELLYARRDGEIAAAAQSGRHLLIGGASGLMDCAF